jgi:hypothetical protein
MNCAIWGWSILARLARSSSKRVITCRESVPGLITFSATVGWASLLTVKPVRSHVVPEKIGGLFSIEERQDNISGQVRSKKQCRVMA